MLATTSYMQAEERYKRREAILGAYKLLAATTKAH